MRRAAVACLLLLLAAPAGASEPELFGMGARSGALGGMGVADATGYDAAYANPAGLVDATRRRLTLGYVFGRPVLRLDGAARPVEDTQGVLVGAALPLPFGGVMKDRLALGVAFYFPTGLINRARAGFPGDPRIALLEDRTQVVSILATVGVRLHPMVSIGGGVLALAALVGEISIRVDGGGNFITVSEQQLVSSFAPVAGVRVNAAPWCKVGLTLRGESRSRYDIRITNQLGNTLPVPLPTLRVSGTAQYDPLQLAAEAAFQVHPWVRLGAGLTWKHWETYPVPIDNATLGAPPQPSPGYHDTVVPRASIEVRRDWRRLSLAGRAGYFFEWSPAPKGPDRYLLDTDRHALTGGFGIEYRGRLTGLQLDLFVQWHHLADDGRVAGDIGVFGATFGVDL